LAADALPWSIIKSFALAPADIDAVPIVAV